MESKSGLLKRMGRISSVVALAVVVGACAVAPRAQYTPYPSAGKDAQEYSRDMAECQAWASSQSGVSPQRGVDEGARGALGAAAVASLIGGLFFGWSGAGLGALIGGGTGAVVGGAQGSQKAQRAYDFAYSDCLSKKGY